MKQDSYRNISLGSLYIKYFWLIFGGMALLIVFALLVASSISTHSQMEALDRKSQQSLALIQSSMDSTLGNAATQASKLAYNSDVESLRRLDRDYVHDYDAMALRLRALRTLRVARRVNLDYNITLYTGVNDYVISTVAGAQKRQLVLDSGIKDVFDSHYAQGSTQFFVRRGVKTSVDSVVDKEVLTCFYGMGAENFIAIDMEPSSLIDLMTGEDVMWGSVPLVLSKSGECMIAGNGGWEEHDLSFLTEEHGGEDALGVFDVGGELFCAYRRQSSVAPIVYALMVPYEVRVMGVRDLIGSILIMLLGGLALSLILAYIISKRVFRPIGVILDFVNSKGSSTLEVNGSYEMEHILLSILAAYQENTMLEKKQLVVYEQMRTARVRALQQQMTPHFLYNTLQAILWMVLEDMDYRESRSSESIKSLSHMVRFCMEGGTVEVALEEELSYVEEYLHLMRLRYGDKIQWAIEASEEARQEMIPKLSIQPLVENAISHSLRHMEHGCVRIVATCAAGRLRVCVRDNGQGMSDEKIEALKRDMEKEFTMNDEHIALMNLNQRLKLIYGESAGLFIGRHEGMMEIGFQVERT